AFIVLEDVSTVYYFSTDTLGAVLLAGSIVCVIYRRPALGGLVFGLAFLGRFSNIAALPGMLFFAAAFGGKHAAYRFTCAFVPGLLGFALGNHLMFGSPFTCSYFRQAYAVDGVLQVVSQERFFSFEHVGRNLWNMFINRSTGFAVSAPLMLFGFLFGLPALWRNARPTVLAIVVISAGQLLFFAFYENALANGGGPRHVLGMLMLWAAPLAACFDQALMPGQNR
ncbi:MAG TPA: hypothetical protein PLP17_03665, partial [Oligoflexia bacterium]|nr:hypothetical protein [Oligoflexia bacterium]